MVPPHPHHPSMRSMEVKTMPKFNVRVVSIDVVEVEAKDAEEARTLVETLGPSGFLPVDYSGEITDVRESE